MGANSTLRVSKNAARNKLIQLILCKATTSQLEEILYDLWGQDKLYNFEISNAESELDDHKLLNS